PNENRPMKQFQASLLGAVVFGLLIGIVSLSYQKGVEAQLGSTPVRVVNTSTSPALGRDVDRREPYQATGFTSSSAFSAAVFLPAVPAGKRLVIEYVSVRAFVPIGQQVDGQLSTSSLIVPLEVPFQSSNSSPGQDAYIGSQKVLIFVNAGETPEVT